MTRKNMGGLLIDLDCRVLDANGKPIPGLFAAGEVAGLGGLNGKAGLEGTFLGPSLVQGRRAGRAAVPTPHASITRPEEQHEKAPPQPQAMCQACHQLPMSFLGTLPGFSHFARAHKMARERSYPCSNCHAEIELLRPWRHRISPLAQTESCSYCHLPQVKVFAPAFTR
jgi:succinate dehydrogenase/fumarate reductase flavoprotein subunit